MKVTTVGIDLAKNVFQLHGVNEYGKTLIKKQIRRDQMAEFGNIEDARSHCQKFFAWYNGQHCHSGIGHMTPHSVHYGQAKAMREVRQATLNSAFHATPNRFKGIRPCLMPMPTAAWINPPPDQRKPPETPYSPTP